MMKNVQSELQQLGQDLESGNLTQAESDYTTLSQDLSEFSSLSTSTTSSNDATTASTTTASTDSSTDSLEDAFTALGQDLESGNLSAAQSDYTTLQNDLQQATGSAPPPPPPATSTSTSTSSDTILQELSELGTDLSSGDLTSAQTTYTTLEQDLAQIGLTGLTSQLATGTVSVSG